MGQASRGRVAGAAGWLVIAGGIAFTLYLQRLIPGEVFFSGDGGLKAILAKQFARDGLSNFHWHFDAPAEKWAAQLWDEGLYPFVPPYVYVRDGRRYMGFPPYFSLLTAPFYAWFGWRGYYVLPIASVWGMWLVFMAAARRMGVRPWVRAAGLAALVFGSPLTLNSALYWEHTPAVFLAFAGVCLALIGSGAAAAVAAGALLGLAGWLRPELIWFGALFMLLFCAVPRSGLSVRMRGALAVAFSVSVGAFMAINLGLSGSLLGFHGEQMTRGAMERLHMWRDSIGTMLSWRTGPGVSPSGSPGMAATCPIVLAVGALLMVALPRLVRAKALVSREWILAIAVAMFVLSVPFFLPGHGDKQWGPRFLFMTMPVMTLLGAKLVDKLLLASRAFGWTAAGMLSLSAAVGGWTNGWSGTQAVRQDYACRIYPALQTVLARPGRVAAVSDMYVAQELAGAFERKFFVLATNAGEFVRIGEAMLGQGERQLVYVLRAEYRGPPAIPFLVGSRRFVVRFHTPQRLGALQVIAAEIVDSK